MLDTDFSDIRVTSERN